MGTTDARRGKAHERPMTSTTHYVLQQTSVLRRFLTAISKCAAHCDVLSFMTVAN